MARPDGSRAGLNRTYSCVSWHISESADALPLLRTTRQLDTLPSGLTRMLIATLP